MAHLTDHNVVGTFPDLDRARDVIKQLNDAGIDGDDISMLGRQVDEVSSDPDTRLRDLDSTADLGKKAAAGGVTGSAIGAGIAGAVALLMPGVGPVLAGGIWAALAGGATAGGVVGGMVGAIGATELGPEWEASYGEPLRAGRVVVAVHARDHAEAEQAAKVLEKEGADRVDHLDHEGRPLEGGGAAGSATADIGNA
jgi:hypothetical protein